MDLKKYENRTAADVRKTKVPWVVVKTKTGLRRTMQSLYKAKDYLSIIKFEDGKTICYDNKGKKKRTIDTPKKGITTSKKSDGISNS